MEGITYNHQNRNHQENIMSADRNKRGSVKQAIASLSDSTCAVFSGFRKRGSYYRAAERIGLKISIRQMGGQKSQAYQVRLSNVPDEPQARSKPST